MYGANKNHDCYLKQLPEIQKAVLLIQLRYCFSLIDCKFKYFKFCLIN